MPGLGLQEEEQVRILLELPVVWVMAFGCVHFLEMFLHLVLLGDCEGGLYSKDGMTHLIESHAVLNKQANPRIKETDVAFEDKVAFGLGRDARLQFSQSLLRCMRCSVRL